MVKDGYKQTDIGVIPEDWGISQIDEHCTIRTGNKNTQDKKDSGIYPFFVRSQIIENIDSYSFDGEAILTAGDGVGTGKVHHYINGKFDFHQRVYCMTDFSNSVDGYYFYLYFKNNFFNRISKMTAKSSVDSVRREMIAKMLIPIPPKEEQKAIAKSLSDTDELINSLEKLIAKKEAIKQGTMQQLLTGKKRLSGFSGEWEEKRLEEVSKITMGQSPSSSNYNMQGMGLPLVQGNADIKNRQTIIRNYTSEITKKAFTGDIIMSVRAPVGEIAKTNFDCCIGRGVCSINTNGEYLYYYLTFIEPTWTKSSTGSTFDSVNSDVIKSLPFFMPTDIKEQNAISQILSDMDNEIETLKSQLSKTKAIKDGMMSELLTGNTRLSSWL